MQLAPSFEGNTEKRGRGKPKAWMIPVTAQSTNFVIVRFLCSDVSAKRTEGVGPLVVVGGPGVGVGCHSTSTILDPLVFPGQMDPQFEQ